jgi:hypothetical protein
MHDHDITALRSAAGLELAAGVGLAIVVHGWTALDFKPQTM